MGLMSKLAKAPSLLERAFAEWRKQETLRRSSTSIGKFADFLGYSRTIVGFWLNGDRPISEDALISILPKLAELLGLEVYDELEIPRPNFLYQFVVAHWDNLPPDEQKRITKIIAKYTTDPVPDNADTQPAPKS
jgi:hypothetical protein